MLNTNNDIITEVLVRNNRSTTDGFITDTTIQGWLKDAHTWAASYHKWSFTEGKTSTTFTTSIQDDLGNTIVPYPEGWKADSVRMMTIGGKRLNKVTFASLARFTEDYSTNTDRIYSDFGRQLYVNGRADVSGTLVVYGQYTPLLDVTDLTATTIFSGYDEEGNEALIEKMTSYMKRREHLIQEAEMHDQRAAQKLEEIWKRSQDEQFAYQAKNQTMFEDVDVLEGLSGSFQFKRNQF